MSRGVCHPCRRGEPTYRGQFYTLNLGGGYGDNETVTTDVHGAAIHDHFFGQSSFANYALANVRNVVKVRQDARLELLGPLGYGLQTGAGAVLNALQVKPGSTFVTFGGGAVGLAAAMAARSAGAQRIIAVDILAHRLALALELGVTDIVNASECDPVAKVIEISGGGADDSLESTGLPRVVRQAVDALVTRGTCGIVGAPPLQTEASFDVNGLMIPGKTIRGIVEGDSIPQIFIPQLIGFFLQGRFPFDRLVRFYDFENINEAMADTASGRTIKPILKMS
jgi:aryl-alcohol dehydrogenase